MCLQYFCCLRGDLLGTLCSGQMENYFTLSQCRALSNKVYYLEGGIMEVKMIFRGFTSSLEKRSHYYNKENECIDSC